MDVGQIKEEVNAFKQDIENVVTSHVKYYKLWLFRFSVRLFTSVFWSVIFLMLFFFAFIFFAVAGALALSEYLESMPLGFLLVGIIFVLVMLFVFFFMRKRINRLWLRKLSEIYFQE